MYPEPLSSLEIYNNVGWLRMKLPFAGFRRRMEKLRKTLSHSDFRHLEWSISGRESFLNVPFSLINYENRNILYPVFIVTVTSILVLSPYAAYTLPCFMVFLIKQLINITMQIHYNKKILPSPFRDRNVECPLSSFELLWKANAFISEEKLYEAGFTPEDMQKLDEVLNDMENASRIKHIDFVPSPYALSVMERACGILFPSEYKTDGLSESPELISLMDALAMAGRRVPTGVKPGDIPLS